jgi:hypothetical protein
MPTRRSPTPPTCLGLGTLTAQLLAVVESVTGTALFPPGGDIDRALIPLYCQGRRCRHHRHDDTETKADLVPDFMISPRFWRKSAQMRRSGLLLSWCVLVACAGQEASSAEAYPGHSPSLKATSHQPRLVPARYFVDPTNRRRSVQAIREVMEPRVTLAGHYSQAIVNCGTGCTIFWIVDRRTGAIIEVPLSSIRTEAVGDVRGRIDSDRVEVVYGPNPALGLTGPCRARSFRLRGIRFTPISRFSPAPCS